MTHSGPGPGVLGLPNAQVQICRARPVPVVEPSSAQSFGGVGGYAIGSTSMPTEAWAMT